MPWWHTNEKTYLPTSVDIQKLLWQEGKICLLGTNCNEDHPLLKL
jgi:hypothetical protein